MIWLYQFAKAGRIKTMKEAIKTFFQYNGRMPSSKEIKNMEGVMREAQGKTADIIQFPKDRITDWWRPRPGDPKYVDSVIKDLKSKDPIDAMKEANLIIGRKNPSYKGPYKNLSDDEAQRILKETDDHIFQRDIKGEFEPEFASGGIAGPLHLYDGGRARFDKGGMDRRGFLKLLGGLGALPLIGKYFKAAKTAAPAVEKITTVAGQMPEYALRLIEVVKNKGIMEVIEGLYKRNPSAKKYTYKGVEVTEDGLGNTQVRKTYEGVGTDATTGKSFEGINREVGFDITKGENIVKQGGVGDDAGKVIKTGDDYFEATVRPDREGKLKDMEEFIDEADHLDLKAIADESLIKKAEGGRVDLSKGGLAHVLGV